MLCKCSSAKDADKHEAGMWNEQKHTVLPWCCPFGARDPEVPFLQEHMQDILRLQELICLNISLSANKYLQAPSSRAKYLSLRMTGFVTPQFVWMVLSLSYMTIHLLDPC